MWLGVSVASQGSPGGRVLVSFSLYLVGKVKEKVVWLQMLALVNSGMGGVWMVVGFLAMPVLEPLLSFTSLIILLYLLVVL